MTITPSKTTIKGKVYHALLTHEYTSAKKLCAKLKLRQDEVSWAMTQLRREGLASYRPGGHSRQPGGLQWKKHKVEQPLSPPQPDLHKRKGRPVEPVGETTKEIVARINQDLHKLKGLLEKRDEELEKYRKVKQQLQDL